ncbi:MAG: hypothetical protein DBY36_08175 [Clostridiales bacterium]|nr:MAG: hypothetical protein DBY36_08175 [Clostridiales bacterium]
MKNKFRVMAMILAVLMLAMSFAACQNNENDPDTTSATNNSTPVTSSNGDSTSTPATTTDDEINLDGYAFVWVKPTHSATGRANMAPDNETELGIQLTDIYNEIEDRYNCTIEINQTMGTDFEALMPSAVGGVKYADAVCTRQSNWIPLAMMGGLRALDSQEMLDAGLDLYNENVFNQIYTQMTNVKGKIWGFDMSGIYDNIAMGHCYAFNKRIVENAGYPAEVIFDAVRNGTWTYDYFLEIARACVSDPAGDGLTYPVGDDIWGIALDGDGNEIWTNGTGPIVYDEATGKYLSNLTDPQLIKAMEFMAAVNGEGDLMVPEAHGSIPQRGDRRQIFYEGKAAFAGLYGGNFNDSNTGLMEDDFGVVPFPKGPDTDKYIINMVDLDSSIIMTSNTDYAKTAVILNAIGEKVTDFEAYKELVLESFRGCEDSVDVLFNYAFPNAFMNIAKCSSEMHEIMRKQLYSDIYTKNMSVAQAAETYTGKIQAELDGIFRQ